MKMNLTYITGSRFYGLETEKSDKDYYHLVIPTKEMLLSGQMASCSFKDETNNDHVEKDIRAFIKELKKGSLRAVEVLYSIPINEPSNDLESFLNDIFIRLRDDILNEIRLPLMKAISGEIVNRGKRLLNYLSNDNEYNRKEYVHILKLNNLFNYLICGDNPFIPSFNNLMFYAYLKEIRETENYVIDFRELEELINKVSNTKIDEQRYPTSTHALGDLEFIVNSIVLSYSE